MQKGVGIIGHVARAGDAVYEIERAVVVTEMLMIVPQSRHEKTAVRVDDFRIRRWFQLGIGGNTYDALTDWYKHFRSAAQIAAHLRRLGLEEIHVQDGWNGVEARGRRPLR